MNILERVSPMNSNNKSSKKKGNCRLFRGDAQTLQFLTSERKPGKFFLQKKIQGGDRILAPWVKAKINCPSQINMTSLHSNTRF